jgi:hypothetical protein
MPNLGRYARVSAAREVVWEILRREPEWARYPFTAKDFYEKHEVELETFLKPLNPEASILGMVKGTLQSLAKKGLIEATRRWGNTTYKTNVYIPNANVIPYTYGRALLEAQRLRLL